VRHDAAVADSRLRQILVMADYSADPLWDRSPGGGGMIPLDELSISLELGRDLRSWADRHDDALGDEFRWPSEAERAEWTAAGKRLAERLQEELAGAAVVTYAPEG
jgi:hypothetical protein